MDEEKNDRPLKLSSFKCMKCEQVVQSTDGRWPDSCPYCQASDWMTTMDGIHDREALQEEELPDAE